MNLLRNSINQVFSIRQRLPATLRLFSSAEVSPVLNDDKIQTVEPELDKLYKRIELEIKGNDPAVLKSYVWFAKTACKHLGIELGKCWAPKRPHFQRWTLLKSRHVHAKHKVQYEIRTYYENMHLHRLTSSTSDTILEYFQRNLPEGVAMKVTKVEILPLPEYMESPPNNEEKPQEKS